jgi:hypothetical protein
MRFRRWWQLTGRVAYRNATDLLITADAGGSNGPRVRLWKCIATTWRGKPLVSLVAVVGLIGSTRTASGLRVRSEMDRMRHQEGVLVTDEQMARVNLERHTFHGDWSYSLQPARAQHN